MLRDVLYKIYAHDNATFSGRPFRLPLLAVLVVVGPHCTIPSYRPSKLLLPLWCHKHFDRYVTNHRIRIQLISRDRVHMYGPGTWTHKTDNKVATHTLILLVFGALTRSYALGMIHSWLPF